MMLLKVELRSLVFLEYLLIENFSIVVWQDPSHSVRNKRNLLSPSAMQQRSFAAYFVNVNQRLPVNSTDGERF